MADAEDIAEIKASIAISRKRDLNFALCYGKKPEDLLITFHRNKNPEVLMRQVKKEGETNKVAFGSVRTKGKVFMMSLQDEPPPGLIRQGKRFFSSIGVKMKLKLLSADGTVLEADEDITPGDEIDEDEPQAAEDPNEAKWLAARKKVAPALKAALTSDHPEATKIRAAWAMAVERADGKDFAASLKILTRLVPLLKSDAGTSTADDGDETYDGPSKQDLAGARILWVNARAKMLAEMKRLETTILTEERADDINEPDELAEIEDRVAEMVAFLDPFDGKFEDALEDAVDAETPEEKHKTLGEALRVLDEFTALLNDGFFKAVDTDNGYLNVAVASTGKSAISEITKRIG